MYGLALATTCSVLIERMITYCGLNEEQTTIQSQPYKLGQILAKTVVERIENPETPIYTMLTDATLVKRLTTRPVVKKS